MNTGRKIHSSHRTESDIANNMRWQVGEKMGLIVVGRSQPPQAHQIMFVAQQRQHVRLITWLEHTDVARVERLRSETLFTYGVNVCLDVVDRPW